MGHVARFTSHGQRDLLKIPRPDALRILYRLTEFPKALDSWDTAAFDIKALRGHNSRWRLRVRDYRIVYTVEDGQLIVWVMVVGNHRDVYRDF